jgi:predicted DNA-binding transcriptional regulator YafY
MRPKGFGMTDPLKLPVSKSARLAAVVLERAQTRGEVLTVDELADELGISLRRARYLRAELREAGVEHCEDGRRV